MAKYDQDLNRMLSLMEDKNTHKAVSSNIEYHANGADGKVYGILKEGTKYYIKETTSGKENLSESYEYIGGFNNRKANEFRSYNDATKKLELNLMALNERYGKHENVSTVDFGRSEKVFANLTESARKELDRMHQIFENSCKIGMNCVCDEESKGKATPEQTEKNNAPFEEKATASLDKDPKTNGTVENATSDYDKVSEPKMDDTSMRKGGKSQNDYKDTHDDLDGEGVADKKAKGGKVVKVNEGMFEDGTELTDADFDMNTSYEDVPVDNTPIDDASFEDASFEDVPTEDTLVGDNEEDLDTLIAEMEANLSNATKSVITGPEKTLDGPKPEGTNGVDGETSPEWKRIQENEDGNVNEPTKQGNEETMKSYQRKGNLPAQSWDKMDKKDLQESIARITESVYEKLGVKKTVKESLQDKIDRIVKEEVSKLDVWGKHPKYGKPFMTTPANKEVLAGTADRDFNDDSAKGEQPYGKKIGDSAPFVKNPDLDMLTDQVLSQLKEALKRK